MNLRRTWKTSILFRVATVLGAVSLLAVGVVFAAASMTEQAAGKGAAINVAGSLRMQSYLLATRVAEAGEGAKEAKEVEALAAARAEARAFEQRFSDPRLTDAVPAAGALHDAYRSIELRWQDLRPNIWAASDQDASPIERTAARSRFLAAVHPFVVEIDAFVHALEADLEGRIHGLQVALGGTLFVILILMVTAFFVLDVQVFQPIKNLVQVTQAVRCGTFELRAGTTGEDELGQLGRNFNHMVEELGHVYGSLEAQIAAKTADLAEKNRSLSLLYETARELSGPAFDRATAVRVATRVREVFGVAGVGICARPDDATQGWPLASVPHDELICGRNGCDACVSPHRPRSIAMDRREVDPGNGGMRSVVRVPLIDGAKQYGVMPLLLSDGTQLASWQFELAQTVGRHIAAAMATAEARDEHRRLALMEERSAIARELHDSLAQALSYTQMQLVRLSRLLAAPPREKMHAQAREVVGELRDGVSSAYRQLRELLTTFRLQLSGRGLGSALAQAVADFSARCGVPIQLHDELVGTELSANEQIHVLQIAREALANVEHHARAKHAWVALRRVDDGATVVLTIEDDGIGLTTCAPPRHHFGMAIMRDRAELLGGSLEIGPRQQAGDQGTCVCLRFNPQAACMEPAESASTRPTPAARKAPHTEIHGVMN